VCLTGLTLLQTWPALSSHDRDTLAALATAGSYHQAAESLGISYETFKLRISRARRRFRTLWHEWETPRMPVAV
jgi:DNA-directed RNA polymerase specialized sigma24 family protein